MPTIPSTSSDSVQCHAPDYEKLGYAYGIDQARFLNASCGHRAIELFDDWRAAEQAAVVRRLEFLHASGASIEQLADFTFAANAGMKAEFARDPVLCALLERFVQPTFH
ncbi:hypothetical protein ARD30_16305 [Bosea thiooxidans]|uniref:Uncharacterized protein n=1 Tax=Bosea thiooxidans TaxID=53254 RepID=A0A0Q3I559_9HYPH|nr:hypothetical protein [Bosea thiooxidans]KQK30008.1 hypothetical protein ARD30_16305 [Bosea thiooxidans]